MFGPPESLPFPIDLTLCARYLPNDLAIRLVRRRVQDADEIARAEAGGDQGLSDRGYDRTQDARDLLETQICLLGIHLVAISAADDTHLIGMHGQSVTFFSHIWPIGRHLAIELPIAPRHGSRRQAAGQNSFPRTHRTRQLQRLP